MIKRLLIANRGEIACRIARSARRLAIATVAVYSDADRRALHVEAADQAVFIGPAPAIESYLSIDAILRAARETGADAIHPGYGFLSESAAFAEACTGAGLVFIGPTPAAMRTLGGKSSAKALARSAGVPVVPGYDGESQDPATLRQEAARIGFPMLVKAVAGGGGRGMRRVERLEDFEAARASAVREAEAAFGDGRVLLEKLIISPRHIEVQVFADRQGNVLHLFERECTLQRRHQKVIEEAPAPGMTAGLRRKLTGAAVTLAKSAHYEGAGTVEFLIEGGALTPAAEWYFIEINTRLQVEHPVTEAITGLDLVEWQLRVASGEPLPVRQSAVTQSGHAIETRLCAEDPAMAFLPQSGPIIAWREPELSGVRIDSGFAAGRTIPSNYDSLIAKIISHRPTRTESIEAAVDALTGFRVAGPRTNAQFLTRLLAAPEFASASFDTGYIDRNLDRLSARTFDPRAAAAGVLALLMGSADRADRPSDPWSATHGFQLGGPRRTTWRFLVDGEPVMVAGNWSDGSLSLQIGSTVIRALDTSSYTVHLSGGAAYVLAGSVQITVSWPDYTTAVDDRDAAGRIDAPITGRIAAVLVSAGDKVARGATIAVVEAMKMEHIIKAPRAGTIGTVEARHGDQIAAGRPVATYAGDERA